MLRNSIILHSPMMPAEAIEALRDAVDEERWSFSLSGYAGDRPVLGKFQGDSFRLRKRIFYNNGGARFFYGRLLPESGGTRIEGRFQLAISSRVFSGLWFGVVFLVCLGELITWVKQILTGEVQSGTTWENFIPFGMLFAALILFMIGRMLSRSGERFIVEHLKATLLALAD